MFTNFSEWLEIIARWFHIIAGIAWIGSSFFFMWMDSHLESPEEGEKGLDGRLWMVHSGGFYHVEKKFVSPEEFPSILHWFKWEAALTWISGIFLLGLVYYMGGGVYLLDSSVSDISHGGAIGLGIATLVIGFGIYDQLWKQFVGKSSTIPGIISLIGLFGIAYFLSTLISGRAAYIHVGALMGTCMVANVWMRIIPAQRAMVKAVKAGTKADFNLGKQAKQRSVHNNYMTLPLIFIMISNHYPMTYGHHLNWLILVFLFIGSAAVRHYMNIQDDKSKSSTWVWPTVIACFAVLLYMTGAPSEDSSEGPAPKLNTSGKIIDLAQTGSVSGLIDYTGPSFKRKRLKGLPASCVKFHENGEVLSNKVMVKESKLKNVFVWVSKGLEAWQMPELTKEEAILDQRGCMYYPRVVGARVGQKVSFLNSDAILHNVHSLPKKNRSFNLGMAGGKNLKLTKSFNKEEVPVLVKCDLHPWMAAYVGVVDHPFFSVSDENGKFKIQGLPAGEYQLNSWHEVFGKQTETIQIKAKEETKINFSFNKK